RLARIDARGCAAFALLPQSPCSAPATAAIKAAFITFPLHSLHRHLDVRPRLAMRAILHARIRSPHSTYVIARNTHLQVGSPSPVSEPRPHGRAGLMLLKKGS